MRPGVPNGLVRVEVRLRGGLGKGGLFESKKTNFGVQAYCTIGNAILKRRENPFGLQYLTFLVFGGVLYN